MAKWRELAIDAGMAFFHASGAHRLAERFTRGVGAILTFHHVRPRREQAFEPNRLLEITPEFLDSVLTRLRQRGFAIVSLDSALQRLRRGAQEPFAVLTFDDGYRDLASHALPVLERHSAPFVAYVTPGFADGVARLWWVELEEAIRGLDRIDLVAAGRIFSSDCVSAETKRAAFAELYARLRAVGEGERLRIVRTLAAQARIEPSALPRSLCLGWNELRALARHPLATIGAHTLTHPRLADLDCARAIAEMDDSRRRIETELGVEARHFCYPYGDSGSAAAREFDLARSLGFASAVTTRPGLIFPEHREHLRALPRVSINGLYQSVAQLDILLSGAPFALWNGGRRVLAA
jgi:peptidoglycan/xylan/chitin deacetylase (PgdA/CDA1 family)